MFFHVDIAVFWTKFWCLTRNRKLCTRSYSLQSMKAKDLSICPDILERIKRSCMLIYGESGLFWRLILLFLSIIILASQIRPLLLPRLWHISGELKDFAFALGLIYVGLVLLNIKIRIKKDFQFSLYTTHNSLSSHMFHGFSFGPKPGKGNCITAFLCLHSL